MKQYLRMPSLRELLVHLAMGVSLGLLLSLGLIVSNGAHVFDMIINSATPKVTMVMFVGIVSSLMGVGAALSGFVFTATDNS